MILRTIFFPRFKAARDLLQTDSPHRHQLQATVNLDLYKLSLRVGLLHLHCHLPPNMLTVQRSEKRAWANNLLLEFMPMQIFRRMPRMLGLAR